MRTRYSALFLVLSLLTLPLYAEIYVDDGAPGDPWAHSYTISDPNEDGSAEHPFDSIQDAIDAARDGDTIIVAPGQYLSSSPWDYGEIDFGGKNIRLVGSAPTDFSVVDETVLCGVVVFQGTESSDCLLQGFKIQNHAHGGILGNNTHAVISHCIISGNGPCGATVIKDVRGRIANCLIVDNTTFHDCGVLPVMSGCNDLINCTIANNLSGVYIGTNVSPPIDHITVRHCIIWGNQGTQLAYLWDGPVLTPAQVEYNLIESSDTAGTTRLGLGSSALQQGDPCFVRLGCWQDPPVKRRLSFEPKKVLVEGDYHLKTEGWRWTSQPIHGSHWYFDASTSCAVDAGDPMESLGEELERAPGDPEGQWGVNHAIDLGAYGGTSQASLAPNRGRPLGVGTVDLRDYWRFDGDYIRVSTSGDVPEDLRRITVTGRWASSRGFEAYHVRDSIAPAESRTTYCIYVDYTLYTTQDAAALNLLPQISEQLHARYPQYLTVGSTVEVPVDPFVSEATISTLVVRGALAEVIAGTGLDLSMFVDGAWHDVIAFCEKTAPGAPGAPIAIFARGFGPLMLGGQPVVYGGGGTRRR